MPDILHILVIWAISFKAHKILHLEKQQSLIILFSFYTTWEGSIKTKIWGFSPLCKKSTFQRIKSRSSPPTYLYECLKMENHFITKCAKKERKTEVFCFFHALNCPHLRCVFQLCWKLSLSVMLERSQSCYYKMKWN